MWSDKIVDERIDEGVLWEFGYEERMENNRIAKRVYIEECAGSCSMGMLWKRWIDIVKESLRKRNLRTSKSLFYKHSFAVSIHLFCSYQYTPLHRPS